jgi:hypothetical protein
LQQAATNSGPLHAVVAFRGDTVSMDSTRPESANPIPMRMSHRSLKTLIVRFVGLLIAAIAVMALIYS